MKKSLLFAMVAVALAGCTNHDLVDQTGPGGEKTGKVAIGFNVGRQNMTRSTTALETLGHYNFGVWAYKSNAGANATEVMNHYLVGYSGTNVGYYYDVAKTTTFAATPGATSDHTSPWIYEGLGTEEYTYSDSEGYYTASQTAYMSSKANQYLRYWDLAFTNTDFYCYAPYNSAVTFDKTSDEMSIPKTVLMAGYDNPQDAEYDPKDHALSDFMYAGVRASNASLTDVDVNFKRVGAQVFIRFYEDIPGYRVEIVDLDADNGTFASSTAGKYKKGIQATPAALSSAPTTYSIGNYLKAYDAKVKFDFTASPIESFVPQTSEEVTSNENLMFKIPTVTAPTALTTDSHKLTSNWDNTGANVIEEWVSGTPDKWSYSPTVYYPLQQASITSTGFTFHVTYRIIAKDNYEQITVHNATVFVPAYDETTTPKTPIAAWQNNTRYTYTFKITKNTSGTTNPTTTIDPRNPTPSTEKALYPIVFDNVELEDYVDISKEYNIND